MVISCPTVIIQDLSSRKEETIKLIQEVFQEYWKEANTQWFKDQLNTVNIEKSLGILINDQLVAVYLMKEENYPGINGKGLHGEALAIKKEYRGQRMPLIFFDYIKANYDHDYLWGTASKKLNNLGFWLKYRTLLKEDDSRYYTIQYLKK